MERRNNSSDKLLEDTLKKLLDLFGANLLSVSSFLEATGNLKSSLLIQLAEPIAGLIKSGSLSSDAKSIPATLKELSGFGVYIITAREIIDFADDFPIELVHIKSRYRKLYGEDPLGAMEIKFERLKTAVKVSMQGILMQLRTAYLSQNYDDLFVKELILKIYPTLESALFLRSQSIPVGLSQVVFKIENCYNTKNNALTLIATSIENGNTKNLAEKILPLLTALEEILAGVKGIKGSLPEES